MSQARGAKAITGVGPDTWWQEVLMRAVQSPVFDSRRLIFTNRTMRFDEVRAIGFDFDHTLAIYNTPALDELAMKLVVARLIEEESYSADFADQIPAAEFACKGIIVDIVLGNVLKIDRYGHVIRAYRGKHRLTRDERRAAYGEANVIPMVTEGDRFRQVDSAYAKPDVLIFTALAATHGLEDCTPLWNHVRHHTDMVHRDGTLKAIVMERPLDFLYPDFETVAMLRGLKESGKKLFLLTNSEWEYTCAMFNPALGLPGGPDDLSWVDLFDYVVCHARKPLYFHGQHTSEPVPVAEHDKVVIGGNIVDLESKIGCRGTEVLYVGDHIYADLITSKRSKHWRTMLVISELEDEIEAQAGLPGTARQLKDADDGRLKAESLLHHWTRLSAALDAAPGDTDPELVAHLRDETAEHIKRARHDLRQYIEQRENLRNRMSRATNPYWGSHFRASNELTYYGRQLEDFACVYTSRASNIGLYPPDHYFRSMMDYLPHEMESM